MRWIAFGTAVIVVFLSAVGLLGAWASSVVKWQPQSAEQEIPGYLVGCLAILSIPTIIHVIRAILDLLTISKFEDQSLEQRILSMHGLLEEATDLMTEVRLELADRTAALRVLIEKTPSTRALQRLIIKKLKQYRVWSTGPLQVLIVSRLESVTYYLASVSSPQYQLVC
jgi:hypothetical protein